MGEWVEIDKYYRNSDSYLNLRFGLTKLKVYNENENNIPS